MLGVWKELFIFLFGWDFGFVDFSFWGLCVVNFVLCCGWFVGFVGVVVLVLFWVVFFLGDGLEVFEKGCGCGVGVLLLFFCVCFLLVRSVVGVCFVLCL